MTPVTVGGNIASILTNAVDLATFDKPTLLRKASRDLVKRDGTWKVQAGDTGNGIAARLSIQFVQLAFMNQGVDWYNLQIGQVLNIPCAEDVPMPIDGIGTGSFFYTVEAGDTGNDIAARSGITFEQLDAFNPGVNWYNLQVGQKLIIPSRQMAETTPGSATDKEGEQQGANMPAMESPSFTSSTTGITIIPTDTNGGSAQNNPFLNPSAANAYQIRAKDINTKILPFSKLAATTSVPRVARAISAIDATLVSRVSNVIQNTLAGATASPSVDVGIDSITVRPGDTRDSIATAYDIPIAQLAIANAGIDLGNLKPGTILKYPKSNKLLHPRSKRAQNAAAAGLLVPKPMSSAAAGIPLILPNLIATSSPSSISNPQTYTVKVGDTGLAIAASYGIPFSDLSTMNPGVTWTNLQTGQKLNLPQSAEIILPSSTSRSAPTAASTPPGGMLNRKPGTDVYVMYTGPASTPPYPPKSTWMAFDSLWAANQQFVGVTCNFAAGNVPPNTVSENIALKNSILSVSQQTGVNPSFILAVVMQESNGCVRVPTTSSWEGITNPGLMQSFKGNASCNSNGKMLQPCPDAMIKQMTMEGVAGSKGVGLVPALNQAAKAAGMTWDGIAASAAANTQAGKTGTNAKTKNMDEAMLYYQAARIYNSGSLPADGDLGGATGSTGCHVSDIVNRLMGWVTAPKACSLR